MSPNQSTVLGNVKLTEKQVVKSCKASKELTALLKKLENSEEVAFGADQVILVIEERKVKVVIINGHHLSNFIFIVQRCKENSLPFQVVFLKPFGE